MFFIVALEGCPYSLECVNNMQKLNLSPQVTWASYHNKQQYKSPKIQTFPQVSFKVLHRGKETLVHVGGNDDFQRLLETSQNLKNSSVREILDYLKEQNQDPKLIAPILFLKRKI